MREETVSFAPEEESEPYLFQVGDVIDGRYLVRAHLGQGGMGDVLRVEDQTTQETLALKYCRPRHGRQRFAREARIMESIQSPYVIPIMGSNIHHEPPYFVMPLAERSLESDLPLIAGDETTALEMFRQICLGVQDLHTRGIYHRDLKPANVLRLADGRIVVCDLGLARLESRDTTILTRSIGFLGTEGYLAPEQRQPDGNRNSDARTDVFQLGKVLYQLVTGKHPRLVEFKSLPPGLDHIVRRATSESPSDRYQSVEKLEAALNAYRASKDPLTNPREVLENIVSRLVREYDSVPPEVELDRVMEVLAHGAWLEHSLVIDCLHKIPELWLATIARQHEPALFAILGTYATAIEERVAATQFTFADSVAECMKVIFEYSENVRCKVLALRSMMTAAQRLNRFRAQRVFCAQLETLTTIDLALPVAEMISDHAGPNINGFQGLNIHLCHPAIQEALKLLREEPTEMKEGHSAIDSRLT